MLKNGRVAARLPAQDLERARAFYAEKLGLEPAEERRGRPALRLRRGEFALFESTGAAAGDHTQMGWEVDDIEATVSELRAAASCSRSTTCPGSRRSTASLRSRATTRARDAASAAPGSATARGTCSGSANQSLDRNKPPGCRSRWGTTPDDLLWDRPVRNPRAPGIQHRGVRVARSAGGTQSMPTAPSANRRSRTTTRSQTRGRSRTRSPTRPLSPLRSRSQLPIPSFRRPLGTSRSSRRTAHPTRLRRRSSRTSS